MRLFLRRGSGGICSGWVKLWDKKGESAMLACAAVVADCSSLRLVGGLDIQWSISVKYPG